MTEVYHCTQLPLFAISAKVCTKCGIEKALDSFSHHRLGKNGYRATCKNCDAEYRRANKERANALSRQRNNIPDPSVLTKKCPSCQSDKLVSDFQKARREKDGYKRECKQCRSKDAALYRTAHPEHVRAIGRASQMRRAAHRRVYHQHWYISNREKIRVQHSRYASIHRKDALARNHQLKTKHPERYREYVRRYQARKRGATVGRVDYNAIIEQYGYICHICTQEINPHDLHFDHVVPLFRGGAHSADNIKPSHGTCNIRKGPRLMEELSAFHRRGPTRT